MEVIQDGRPQAHTKFLWSPPDQAGGSSILMPMHSAIMNFKGIGGLIQMV